MVGGGLADKFLEVLDGFVVELALLLRGPGLLRQAFFQGAQAQQRVHPLLLAAAFLHLPQDSFGQIEVAFVRQRLGELVILLGARVRGGGE